MEAIKDIIKLPEQQQAVSEAMPASTTQSQSDLLTTAQEAVRVGNSPKAAELMRLPLRYRGKALIKNQQSIRALEVIKKGESLFLTGAQGSGKTHLAIALMAHWYADGLDCVEGKIVARRGTPVFLSAPELMLEIKSSWREQEGHRAEGENDILRKYSNCPFLVIDDLGAEKISDWSRTVLYLLIDRRYRDCRQTIITSNLSQGQLAEQLDARIASRICEMGAVIDLGKKDWRLK